MLERLAAPYCLALAAATLAQPHDVALVNKFETGATRTKTFREVSEFELDSMSQTINGQEINAGDASMDGALERSMEIVDEYVETEDGVLGLRRRTFEDVSGKAELAVEAVGQEEAHTAELTSPLSGETVLCRWDADAEAHEFEFDEGSEGDAKSLQGLLDDAEFQWVAPDEEVEEGSSWTVDLAGAKSFFSPGGSLGWETELEEGSYRMLDPRHVVAVSMISLADASQEIDGQLDVHWKGTREVDGEQLAELTLELEVELSADLTEELARMSESADLDPGQMEFECLWAIEGKGEMTWNLDQGHFHSLALELDSQIEFTLVSEEEFGTLEVEAEVSGTTSWEAEVSD